MERRILVTAALPYANGPIHIGHLVEYIQADIWVRFQKLCGNQCLYFCADDTHGTAIMIKARQENIPPEQLIAQVHREHVRDFADFHIEFDNYYSTHSPENRSFSELVFARALEKGSIVKRQVEQAWCESCRMWLPDRYIRGICPRCKAPDQYGDCCDSCGGTHQPTDLIEPRCANCGTCPVRRSSLHYFFKLSDYEQRLQELIAAGHTHRSVANKLQEWFAAGLRDWDISRDEPYFGFKIPGEQDKYFYVWMDAPIGYMASVKNYCMSRGLEFDKLWNSGDWRLCHFIGKDIMYFHALFWPAMLMAADFRIADRLFVHGFLTVNGEKMSKSRGTFVKARTYLKHLEPEYLRYYYAAKLASGVEDIDLSLADFVSRVNAELVGKFANLASRSIPMLTRHLQGMLGRLDEQGGELIGRLQAAAGQVAADYEQLNYAAAVRTITGLADQANRYVEHNQPWATVAGQPERARQTLTAAINAVRILTIYLKPVLPRFAEKVEQMLNLRPQLLADVQSVLQEHRVNDFVRLTERVEEQKVDAMIEESKETGQKSSVAPAASEPIAGECTMEDFAKVDLRIARVTSVAPVAGADKLLELRLDLGGIQKRVFAGIAKAYRPEQLVGRLVVCVANLQPRKMRFGVSEGMILATGQGDSDIFMLWVDEGARPGQRVH
jgi:methionyl-tRNA synthetase